MLMCLPSESVYCIFAECEKKMKENKIKMKNKTKNVSIHCKIVKHSVWNGSRAKCNWYFNLFMQLTILQICTTQHLQYMYLCYMFKARDGCMEHVVCVCYLTFAMNYDFIIWIDAPNWKRKTENGILKGNHFKSTIH